MIEFRWSAAWLAIGLAACGRIGFDDRRLAGDRDDGGSDVGAAPRCNPETPFGAPVPLADIDLPGAYDSTFVPVATELTAYFYSDRGGDFDLYVATRADRDAAWTVAPVQGVNSTMIDKEPALSPDGTVLVFGSNRPPSDPGGDLWYATLVEAPDTFAVAGRVANLDSPQTDYHPFFQLGTHDFWFASNRTGSYAMFHALDLDGGTFANPTPVTDLDVAGFDTEVAIVAPDGLTMYFRSNRPGGAGKIDIWRASRASTSDPWGAAAPETELNSPELDTPNWISPDLCRIYLSSSRSDASDIFVAQRSP